MRTFATLTLALLLCNPAAHAFEVLFQITYVSCSGNDGALVAEASLSPVPPYTFLWSTGATTAEISGLSVGTYSVTITDGSGEVHSRSYDLGTTPPLEPVLYIGDDVFTTDYEPCPGACNGGISIFLPRVGGGYTITTTPSLPSVDYQNVLWDEDEDFIQYYISGSICDGMVVDVIVTGNCGTSMVQVPIEAIPEPTIDIVSVAGNCNGSSTGNVVGEISFDQFNPLAVEFWILYAYPVPLGPPTSGGGYAGIETQTFIVDDLASGDWILEFDRAYTYVNCPFSVPFTIPDLGTDCNTLSGVLHFETDEDCVQDGLEVGIPDQLMRITPGPYYGLTGPDGAYTVDVPTGAYAVEQTNPEIVQICPSGAPVPFTISTGANAVVDLADSVTTPYNTRTNLWPATSRVGFPFNYGVTVTNENGYAGENVVVDLTYDPTFTFVSATPGVTINTPGQLQWTIPGLVPFEQLRLRLTVDVPPDPALLGTSHTATATVVSSTPEVDLSDNDVTISHTVISSYDPNDKQAFTSSGSSNERYFVDADEHIDYLIRFQNTGNDTAFNITVSDTISALFDMGSLKLLGASHPYTPSITHGNVLNFTFTNIQLPDSNVNEAESHGFVAFRLKPVNDIALGSLIENAADIYFDFNEPVRTNTAQLVVDQVAAIHRVDASTLALAPVPVLDQLTLMHTNVATTIEIHGMDGRLVKQYRGARTIDVSALTPGAYLLRARMQSGEILQGRFVKQ